MSNYNTEVETNQKEGLETNIENYEIPVVMFGEDNKNPNETNKENVGEILPQEKVPFWFENPNILLHPAYLYELFPNESMTYDQKLNAITRIVIVCSIIGFVFTQRIRILIIGAITIFAIFILHHSKSKKSKEGYENPVSNILRERNMDIPADIFDEPDSKNPFSNVLIPDYEYNVNKKPAPPSFNENINDKILTQAKKMVVELNATQPHIADKLFKNLGDEYEFEQSMRQFISQPGTTIPNDPHGSFKDFLYGSMISSKEGNLFSLARNKTNYNLH
jgi:hypothetical protein